MRKDLVGCGLAVALFAFGSGPASAGGFGWDDSYPRAYYYGGYYGYGAPGYYVYGAPAVYGYAGSGPVSLRGAALLCTASLHLLRATLALLLQAHDLRIHGSADLPVPAALRPSL